MYDVSSEYLKAVSKPDREFKILVHFDFKDGSQADFDDHTILNDVEIASQAIAGSANSDKIDIGAAIAAKASLTVIDDNISLHRYTGASFAIYVSLKLENGEFEEVPMGRFWVDASKLSRIGNKISIVGYDSMMSLMYALSDTHRQQLKNQTAEQAVQFLAAHSNCGFEQDLSELPNNNIPLDFDSPQIETARDGVMWIAQLMGCFAHIDRQGYLEFVPIKSTWKYFNEEHTIGTIIAVRNIKGRERYKTRFADDRIHVVGLSMPDRNNKLVTRTVGGLEGDANITVELEKNPLVVNSSLSLWDILGAILTQVRTTYFYAFKTEIINDPALDAGDTIRLQGGIIHGTNKNNDLIGFITHNVWRYRGHHEITNAGQCPIVYAEGGETAVAMLASDTAKSAEELYYLPAKSQAEKASAAGNGHSDRIVKGNASVIVHDGGNPYLYFYKGDTDNYGNLCGQLSVQADYDYDAGTKYGQIRINSVNTHRYRRAEIKINESVLITHPGQIIFGDSKTDMPATNMREVISIRTDADVGTNQAAISLMPLSRTSGYRYKILFSPDGVTFSNGDGGSFTIPFTAEATEEEEQQ